MKPERNAKDKHRAKDLSDNCFVHFSTSLKNIVKSAKQKLLRASTCIVSHNFVDVNTKNRNFYSFFIAYCFDMKYIISIGNILFVCIIIG